MLLVPTHAHARRLICRARYSFCCESFCCEIFCCEWPDVAIYERLRPTRLRVRHPRHDQQRPTKLAAGAAAAAPSPVRSTRKRAADLAKTPDGMVSGSIESERAKVARLLEHAQELEAERDAPFDPTAAGVLVPDVITRPERQQPPKRKRLCSDLHGSVTMRGVGDVAAERREEDEAKAAEVKEKKRLALMKKETAAREVEVAAAAFARCEVVCVCGIVPCPYAKWKRCPTCGPKNGLCKVRACAAARNPLLLGYNPVVDAPEGAQEGA
jgi:hypothetical protein